VVFALDRAGITGPDGPSHHGVLDMALCLRIPTMTVFAPSSAQELKAMFHTAMELEGPAAIRFPRGAARQVGDDEVGTGLKARQLRMGTDVCLMAVGRMVEATLEAADLLAADGVQATVWDVRVVKPLDDDMLADAAAHQLVVTIEDGVRIGGAGSAIADALAARNAGAHAPPTLMLGIPLEYIPHDPDPLRILHGLGLDGPGITASVKRALAPVT
jgi:1-deoxy-D-xylulose-5-phosphate synthase